MDLRLESEDKDRKLVNIYRNILNINSKKYSLYFYTEVKLRNIAIISGGFILSNIA